MEHEDDEVIELELKYCERCGGLWLRVRGLPDVYCAPCSTAMSEVAIGYRSKRGPRLPIRNNINAQMLVGPVFYEKGGMA